MGKTVDKITLLPIDYKIMAALKNVTCLPASWDKKFIKSISGEVMMSEKQRYWMIRLFHKYRRQIRNYETLFLELEPDNHTVKLENTIFGTEIKIERRKD